MTVRADAETDHATVLLMDRPVVPLTPGIARTASQQRRATLQIVTSARSRITLSLRALATADKAAWIVRDSGYYDGLTGRPMTWDGKIFAPVPHAQDYAPAYRTQPSEPLGTHLTLVIRARHRTGVHLGGPVGHLTRLLTGKPPIAWGMLEPAQHPWSQTALTAYVRSPSYTAAPITVVGHNSQAMMELATTNDSVSELTTLTIALPPTQTPPLERLPAYLNSLQAEHPVFSLLAYLGNGRTDLTVEPRWIGATAPKGLAITGTRKGPQGAAAHPVGTPHVPMTWFPLEDGRTATWQHYQALLHHLQKNP